jgi:shikimate kinase
LKHLILVGLSGAGKSTIGRLLHDDLGLPLVDTDRVIEIIQERSVSDIFDADGEAYFRELETLVLKQLDLDKPSIIATGGGMVLREENCNLLKALGTVVWLNTSPEDIVRGIKEDSSRPLLEGDDKLSRLKLLLDERYDFYKGVSDFELLTEGLNEVEVSEEVKSFYLKE